VGFKKNSSHFCVIDPQIAGNNFHLSVFSIINYLEKFISSDKK